MTPAGDAPVPPLRPIPTAVLLALAFGALTVALVLVRRGEVGLWDWDTYGRLEFIDDNYHPELYVDGHVLYHFLVRGLMAVGLPPTSALLWLTAGGAAAFLCLLGWICRHQGLSLPETGLVLTAASLGSPGLVSLYLLLEDNVLYLPVVLGVFFLAYRLEGDRREAVRRGVALGVLLAIAMLINVSLLVLLFAVASAPLLWGRERARAWGVLAAGGTALFVYYFAHVVPFTGVRAALNEFLPQALRLQDFNQSTTPLFSLARLEQYLGGLRAMTLTPSVHFMRLPPRLYAALLGTLPEFMLALLACLLAWVVLFRGAGLREALRARLHLVALFGVCLVFPYFYEPALIERWDSFWVGCLFALVLLLKAKPSRFALGAVVAIVALQSVGTVVTVVHHYGVAWPDPAFLQMRAAARDVVERDSDPAVLPYSVDRMLMADFVHRLPGRSVYLVRDDGRELTCFRMVDLIERQVPLPELQQVLRESKSVYVDPSLSRNTLRLLGFGP